MSEAFNPVIYVYLPPESQKFFTSAFLENMRRNPSKYPLVTFSEVKDYSTTMLLKRTPEFPGVLDQKNANGQCFGVSNLLWYYAMGFAWRDGYSHVLYLEIDVRCRGKNWDVEMFDAMLADPNHIIASGTVAIYNPANTDRKFWFRYLDFIAQHNPGPRDTVQGRNFPIATWGWKGDSMPPITVGTKGISDNTGSCVFTNGAGGIYSVDAFRMLFPEIRSHDDNEAKFTLAKEQVPWDMELGKRIFNKFRDQSFDVVHHNKRCYSTFANVITTEEERLAMLRSGAVSLIHQCKSQIVE